MRKFVSLQAYPPSQNWWRRDEWCCWGISFVPHSRTCSRMSASQKDGLFEGSLAHTGSVDRGKVGYHWHCKKLGTGITAFSSYRLHSSSLTLSSLLPLSPQRARPGTIACASAKVRNYVGKTTARKALERTKKKKEVYPFDTYHWKEICKKFNIV